MPYDLFISYSRRDNERGQVAALTEQIKTSFRAFAGRALRVFFDTQEIAGMDDWRQKIQHSMRESHLFLAVLSPNYLASPYCRWEWEDYVRYEAMRQCLGEGVAPVFFVTLPDAATPQADQSIARWIDEIHHRQSFDLRPWHDHGEQALQEAHVRATLEQLHSAVRDRLDRAERARRSPNNLIKHNPAFVGRVRELTDLRRALAKNALGIVGARDGQVPGRATVRGLGGMGKTELALAYAHAFAWDYPGGRWQIPCEHTGDLRLALSRLAGPMHFEFTEDEKKDLAMQFERVLRELLRRERCLLILDNVSDPHLLEPEYLDRLPRDGHVDLIATTRLAPTTIPGSAQDSTFIAVDELPEEDALALMRSHQPEGRFASQVEDNEARQIVGLLRGFTLAVETAAIYLGRHPAPDACRQFRERLSPDLLRESEQAATDPTVAVRHRVRSLDETLAFTLATLTEEARHLLTFAALLPADLLAVPWLRTLGAERFPAFLGETSPAFRQPLDLLLGLRLFQPGEAVSADGCLLIARMHRLVQDLMRQKTSAADLAARQQTVTALVTERAAALREPAQWQDVRWELEPLGALAVLWADTNHPDAAWLLNHAGHCLYNLADWVKAEPLYRRALAIDEASLGPTNPTVATDIHGLALLLVAANRLTEAEELARRALTIDEQSLGPDHPSVARDLNCVVELLQATDRLAEAEPLMQRALMIDKANFGPNDPTVARDLNILAGLLQNTNRVREAEPLMRLALAIDEANLGPDFPTVARDLNNLALLLVNTNRLAEAEPMYRRALAIWEHKFGENHTNVGSALNNLAGLLHKTHRLAEAELMYRRALIIWEQCFGQNHPNVANVLGNLAQVLQDLNRSAEAELLMRRALTTCEQSLGMNNPKLAIVLGNLALLLKVTKRLTEAVPLMRRVLAIDEQSYGPDHPKVATTLNTLAQLLQDTNHLSEAEPLYRRALAIHERRLGLAHPDVANSLKNLGQLLQATNRLVEAEPMLRRALAIDEQNFGPDHSSVAQDLNNLAQLLKTTNRLAAAEPLMRRALAIDEKALGPNHPEIAIRLNNLGRLLLATNRLAEAEPLMRRALTIDEHNFGPDHPKVAIRLNGIAGLLLATNRAKEAIPLSERSLRINESALGRDHPSTAVSLSWLAHAYQDTNRLAAAEPLMRRAVEISFKFTRDTGHTHSHQQAYVDNYVGLLKEMGRSPQEVLAQLNAVGQPFGIRFGG